jgi:hypothetical protein
MTRLLWKVVSLSNPFQLRQNGMLVTASVAEVFHIPVTAIFISLVPLRKWYEDVCAICNYFGDGIHQFLDYFPDSLGAKNYACHGRLRVEKGILA